MAEHFGCRALRRKGDSRQFTGVFKSPKCFVGRVLDTSKKWHEFLDAHYCKVSVVNGKRPCEDGVTCADCKADGVAALFEEWSKTHKAEYLVVHYYELDDDSGVMREKVCDSRNAVTEFVNNYGAGIEIVDIVTEYR